MEFPNVPIKLPVVIASSQHYVEYYRHKITTGDPLTAVPMASMTVLPICPCLYRGLLWVWCHYMTPLREKKCAKLHHLPLVSLINLLFWLTVIGQERSHNLIQKPFQFLTGLSSSGGIIWLKHGYSLWFSELFIYKKTWVSYVLLKWHCRGWITPKIGVLGVYLSWTTPLETWIIFARNAGCLLFILFGSSWIDCLNPIYIFWPLPYGNYGKSTSVVKYL